MKNQRLYIQVLFYVFCWVQISAQTLPELIPYRVGNKWGYCDASKKIVLTPKYDEVRLFSGERAAVRTGIYWGYINKKGAVVIPIKYYSASDFYGKDLNSAKVCELVKQNPKSSDRKGTLKECGHFDAAIANPDYTQEYRNMLVKSSPCVLEYFLIIDGKGKIKERLDYEINFPGEKRNYSTVVQGKKYVQVEHISPTAASLNKGYDVFNPAGEDLISVKKNGKWGYADTAGNVKVDLKYDYAGNFSEGFAIAQLQGKFVILDKSGTELFTYGNGILIGECHNGLILAKDINKNLPSYKSDKFGYLNTKGEFVIRPQFKNATSFHEGYAIIKDSVNKFHFVGVDGNYVPELSNWEIPVECCSEYLGPVEKIIQQNGLFKVQRNFSLDANQMKEKETFQYNVKFGFINAQGKEITPCEYDSTGRFEGGICKVVVNRKAGIINAQGKRITEIKYDEMHVPQPYGSFYTNYSYKTLLDYYIADHLFKNGLIKVVIDDKVGLIDFNGNEYFEDLK
jgi:WG containing repeat